MASHQYAGKPPSPENCTNLGRLVSEYFLIKPDTSIQRQRVSFGTSGHRGSSLKSSFNEQYLLAKYQEIAEYRINAGYKGPLYLGKDTTRYLNQLLLMRYKYLLLIILKAPIQITRISNYVM